jgi:urea transport system substrate-binding protein
MNKIVFLFVILSAVTYCSTSSPDPDVFEVDKLVELNKAVGNNKKNTRFLISEASRVLKETTHCTRNEKFASTETIKVGVLFSLTGMMAISEKNLVSSVLLAVEEINRKGGLLGKKLEIVLEDAASDWPTFAEKAQKLIDQDQVEVIMCCYTTASKKAVLPVVEQKDHLMFYPVQHEGQECSKNIFYMGSAPNNQLIPAIDFMNKNYPKQNYYLIGSDCPYPRVSNHIIRNYLASFGSKSEEFYIPLGSSEVKEGFEKILKFIPEGGVIINTLRGDTNLAFFVHYSNYLKKEKYPVMSVSISEVEIAEVGPELMADHYGCWSYLMSLNSETNTNLIQAFRNKYGPKYLVNDPMEATYMSVYIWAQAVQKAGTTDRRKVRKNLVGQTFEAAQGKVEVGKNHYLSKFVRIGKILKNGQYEMLYEAPATPGEAWSKWIPEEANNICDWSKDI